MLDKIFKFLEFTEKFRNIKRIVFTNNMRGESDSEHSYQLALMAWYLIESENLDLDRDKAIHYALMHDLVEVYAGDTYFYADKSQLDDKKEREEKAKQKILKEFPEFKSLGEVFDKYEDKNDKESKFIYALDKVLPVLNIFKIESGKGWRERKITMEMLINAKKPKVALSPEVKKYFDELIKILEDNKDLFSKEK